MKFKTLLMGTAAAVAVTGAQAADLSIAEPVDYVRVCDAFGTGYHYIPGTDTCLKFNGHARFEVGGFDRAPLLANHSGNFTFNSSAEMGFTAKSMTEHGVLTGYVEMSAGSDNSLIQNSTTVNNFFLLAKAYVALGPLLVGRTDSNYKGFGAHTFAGEFDNGDIGVDQIRLTWAMHGFGASIGIEDPRDWAASAFGDYTMPAIVAAATWSTGALSTKFGAGYISGSFGSSAWGVHANASYALDMIAPGDAITGRIQYGDSSGSTNPFWGGLAGSSGATWGGFVSGIHYWSPTLSSAATYAYVNSSGTLGGTGWGAAANLVWTPYTGFETGIEALYVNPIGATTGAWTGLWRTTRSW